MQEKKGKVTEFITIRMYKVILYCTSYVVCMRGCIYINKGLDHSVELGIASCLGRLSPLQHLRPPAESSVPLAACVQVCGACLESGTYTSSIVPPQLQIEWPTCTQVRKDALQVVWTLCLRLLLYFFHCATCLLLLLFFLPSCTPLLEDSIVHLLQLRTPEVDPPGNRKFLRNFPNL